MDPLSRTVYNPAGIKIDYTSRYKFNEHHLFLVTEDTPCVQTPDAFKYNLTLPQQSSLYVMHEMELYKSMDLNTCTVFHSAGVLSNALGSGKTCIIIALITLYPTPSNGPVYPMYTPAYNELIPGYNNGLYSKQYKRVLRPTLIFVGYSVVEQWQTEIKKFNPALRVFVIDSVATLNRFYKILYTTINEYEIVIIKNKTITGKLEFVHNEMDIDMVAGHERDIYNMVATMSHDFCFARVVIDDFDTILLPALAGGINTLFTWYVSCTRKPIKPASIQIMENAVKRFQCVEDLLHNNHIMHSDITSHPVLYTAHNVCVHPDYQTKYTNVGRPRIYMYVFKHKSYRVNGLITIVGGDKTLGIMEALNGDSISDAARIAGIEACNVNDIFKALLQQQYTNWSESKRVLELFKTFDTVVYKGLPDPVDPDIYTREDLRAGREVLYLYPGIKQMMRDEKNNQTEKFELANRALEKFKYAVSNNLCQICGCELQDPDEDYCIMPCCHEIIHSACSVQGCQFVRKMVDGVVVIQGLCPFNKTHKVLYTELCYIRGTFDLGSISELTFQPDTETSTKVRVHAPDGASCDTAGFTANSTRNKHTVIRDIIHGMVPGERERINVRIPHLMECGSELAAPLYETSAPLRVLMARTAVPQPVRSLVLSYLGLVPRVLIFANYEDSLELVEKQLRESHIAFERLGGVLSQINECIERFQTGRNNVLVINSTRYCAGLNLQCATDLIFAHLMVDQYLQSQVAGRIQRAGRFNNAKIHFCIYESERVHLTGAK